MAAVAQMLFSSGGGTSVPTAPAAQAPVPAVPLTASAAIASLPRQVAPKAIDGRLLLPAEIGPPQGLYVMVPAGIDVADRRRTALAVAARLAPRGGTAAVFLLEGGAADAHVFGEPACGRLGREHCPDPADTGRAIRELLGRCDQVAVVLLESSRGVPGDLAGRVHRTVFVATADAESVVETYRELKAWCARGPALPAALFVVGTDGAAEAGRLLGRLRRASREFLGCDLANQGFLTPDAAAFAAEHPGPPRVHARVPIGEIWPRLLGADGEARPADDAAGRAAEAAALDVQVQPTARQAAASDAPARTEKTRDRRLVLEGAAQERPYPRVPEASVPAAAPTGGKPRKRNGDSHLLLGGAAPVCARLGVSDATLPAAAKVAGKIGDCPSLLGVRPSAAAAGAQECSVFSAWQPEGREELVAAIEAQPPAMIEKSLRQIIRVDVDEPDAPPLAAVRDDGALVAILLAPAGQPGRPANPQAADPQAAARWLTVHRRLLALAYPHAGIREDVEPSAIVLAPLETPPADGVRRFLPIQLNGHRGIVLLP